LKFITVVLAVIISLVAIELPCPSAQAANNTAEVNLTANVVSLPSVITNDAGWITIKGATLNGQLDDLGNFSSVSVSFEWGTTSGALDKETRPKPKRRTGALRAKAEGDGTIVYGDELNFTTKKWFWWWREVDS
jgi:hypothetical protein